MRHCLGQDHTFTRTINSDRGKEEEEEEERKKIAKEEEEEWSVHTVGAR